MGVFKVQITQALEHSRYLDILVNQDPSLGRYE